MNGGGGFASAAASSSSLNSCSSFSPTYEVEEPAEAAYEEGERGGAKLVAAAVVQAV